MGVPRDTPDVLFYGFIEDNLEVDVPQVDNEQNEAPPTPKKNANKNRPKCKLMNYRDTHSKKKKAGAKQARRYDNLTYLLNMLEKDDVAEMDFNVCEPSMSAFAELFMEREKMKVWNDFINCSEEEQGRLLQAASYRHYNETNSESSDASDVNQGHDGKKESLDDSWEEIPDKRAVHPSYSAEQNFQRIDKKIRGLLKRRHVPMGLLASLEEELVTFFTMCPSSVFVSKLASGFQRMMLHAVCQYLDLAAHSFDHDGVRQTHVENHARDFSPPSPLLTRYLERQS